MSDVIVTDETWDGINKPTVYLDLLGQEVRVGDYIVYVATQGRVAKLVLAKVLEFRTEDAKGNPYGHTQYDYDKSIEGSTGYYNRYGSYFVHTWKTKVLPLVDEHYSRGGRSGKPVTLSFTKLVKVDATQAKFEEVEE